MINTFLTIIIFSSLIAVLIVIAALATSFIVAIFGGGPFVPTPKKEVKRILAKIDIRPGQKLYDIGAGDGRFIHFAEKLYKAKAVGFEIDPFVYTLARFKQIFFKWKGKMIRSNFRKHSLKDADIVICYMLPNTLKKYQKKFEDELKPGCKIISYTFKIGNLTPHKILPLNKKTYIYIIRDKSAKKPTKKKTTSKRR